MNTQQCPDTCKLTKEIYAVSLTMSIGINGKPVFVAVEWKKWIKDTRWNEFGILIQVVRTKEELQKIYRKMAIHGVESITVKYIM